MKRLILALALCGALLSPAFAQVGGLSFPGPGGGSSAPSKSYVFLAAYDNTITTSITVLNYTVTMPGNGGTLIALLGVQNARTINSVVYDPGGANVSLTQNFSSAGNVLVYSGTVPAASGTKTVAVTYATVPGFEAESIAMWLATGLTTGFDTADFTGSSGTITVNSGDFLFSLQYNSGAGATNTWTGSTQAPTGSSLSTIINSGSQFSASADWSAPSAGTFTVAGTAGASILNATFK